MHLPVDKYPDTQDLGDTKLHPRLPREEIQRESPAGDQSRNHGESCGKNETMNDGTGEGCSPKRKMAKHTACAV
jgi:hypothetical protein